MYKIPTEFSLFGFMLGPTFAYFDQEVKGFLSHSHCTTSLSSQAASMKIHTSQSQGAFAAEHEGSEGPMDGDGWLDKRSDGGRQGSPSKNRRVSESSSGHTIN